MHKVAPQQEPADTKSFRMFSIPCSCASFAVPEDYDRRRMHIRNFIPCPKCRQAPRPANWPSKLRYHNECFLEVGA